MNDLAALERSSALPGSGAHRQGQLIPETVLSAAVPKRLVRVSFLLACTHKATRKGAVPKRRSDRPTPGPRSARGCHIHFDRPAFLKNRSSYLEDLDEL